MAIEQPKFRVVAEYDQYEIREYEPYVVAETRVSGDQRSADNSGFGILAGYIFGKNKARPGVATVQRDGAEKISMTAPVISTSPEDEGGYIYSFVMPSKYTLDTLPVPLDGRVSFREVPARIVAAHRFSGRWQQRRFDKHVAILEEALRDDGVETIGEPMLARYNAPFVPGFMRRNEVMFEVVRLPLPREVELAYEAGEPAR